MKIVITGATGSLGSAIHGRLLKRNHDVVGLGRNAKKLTRLISEGREMLNCDILDVAMLEKCFSGADVIIHSAAHASPWGQKTLFQMTNVQGTLNVIEVSKKLDIPHVVFISSASSFDSCPRNIAQKNDFPAKEFRPRNAYSASKYDAEIKVVNSGMKNWIGLRPRAVVGNGDQTVIPRLLDLIKDRKVLIPGKGDAMLDITCMENFLDAVECAVSPKDSAKGRFYNISNGQPRPFIELIMALADKKYGSVKARHIPLIPLRFLASISSSIRRIIPLIKTEPRITHYSLDQIACSLFLDIETSKKALDWEPIQSFEECLEEIT